MSIRVVGYTPEGHRITEDDGPRSAVVHPVSVIEQIAHRPMVIHATGGAIGIAESAPRQADAIEERGLR